MPERCYQCFRPTALCFCHAIPRIDNRTDILILQHMRERSHPFNTARIVRTALRQCELVADGNKRLGKHRLPIKANAGLLYPQGNAPRLADLPPDERPSQLVVIDGTWHQAKTVVRDVPQLQHLPCFRLSPSRPSQYRIRREPDEQSLSTLEATVAALKALEPDTQGLDQLLAAFHCMVESQIRHRGARKAWRNRKERSARPRNFPMALLRDAESLVVAYGEGTPGQLGQAKSRPLPVNWVAQRLGTGARFSCCIRPQTPLPQEALEHMRLSSADFKTALSPQGFNHRWSRFVRADDTLIVYHERTFRLLRQVVTTSTSSLVLKAIYGQRDVEFHSLEDLIAIEGLDFPATPLGSRAEERLAMAVMLVEHLRAQQKPFAFSRSAPTD